MIKVMGHILCSANHRVKTFRSGTEFHQYQIPKLPCCLLLDIHLGEQPDGQAIFRKLLDEGVRIPVVFLTSNVSVPLAVDLIRAAAQIIFCKSGF